jgi:hypothetical protein
VSLELLFFGAVAARDIVSLDAAWKMEWRDFLDCMVRRRERRTARGRAGAPDCPVASLSPKLAGTDGMGGGAAVPVSVAERRVCGA